MEVFSQPCEECKRTGATVCGSCWVHQELSCINCGNVEYFKPRRRDEYIKELYPVDNMVLNEWAARMSDLYGVPVEATAVHKDGEIGDLVRITLGNKLIIGIHVSLMENDYYPLFEEELKHALIKHAVKSLGEK